jgi:glutamine cyclotransferase
VQLHTPDRKDDYYSFTLSAGESAGLALKSAGKARVELLDSAGTLLANGAATANFTSVVSGFAPSQPGVYYAHVVGDAGAVYTLLVTKNAALENEANNDLASAQKIDATDTVLGRVSKGNGNRLFAVTIAGILELDPQTGAQINQFPAPVPPSGGPDGLAFNGKSLFYINGTRTLWELDPDTGAVIDSDALLGGTGTFDSCGFLNGKVYIIDYTASDIFEFDPDSDTVLRVLDINGNNPGVAQIVGGLAGARDPDRLIVTDGLGFAIYEIDPATSKITSTFRPPGGNLYAGMAVIHGEVYLGTYTGPTKVDVYSRAGELLRTLPIPANVSALGGDDAAVADDDWYQINVRAGANLTLSTTTPGDGPDGFGNPRRES